VSSIDQAYGEWGVYLDVTSASGSAPAAGSALMAYIGADINLSGTVGSGHGDVDIRLEGGLYSHVVSGSTVIDPVDAAYVIRDIGATGPTSDVTINGVGTGATTYIDLTGALTATNTASISVASGCILSGNTTTQVITAHDISLSAPISNIGTAPNPVRTWLTGGQLDGSDQDDIFLTETSGDMRVGTIASSTGDVTLTAVNGGIVDARGGASTNVSGNTLTLSAAGGIGSPADALRINSAVAGPGSVTATAQQAIALYEVVGNLTLGAVASTAGGVWLTAAGSVLDGDTSGIDVSGTTAVLVAGGGIGTANNALETQVSKLEAAASGGGIWLTNAGGLTIGGISGLDGLSASGPIVVVALSPITVEEDVTAGADITLTATDTSGPGQDLTVTNGAKITSTGGSVTLLAGDNFTLDGSATVVASGNVLIEGDYGNADPGFGSTIQINGPIFASRVDILGNADDDTINLQIVTSPTFVDDSGGSDTINVSSDAPVNHGVLSTDVKAILTITGLQDSTDTINVSDLGDPTGQTGFLTAHTLTGLGMPAEIDYFVTQGTLNVLLGQGNDTFNVLGTSILTNVYGDPGNDTFNVSDNAPTDTGTLDAINGPLNIDGGSGANTLFVSDSGSAVPDTPTITDHSITGLSPAPITYTATGGNFHGGITIDGGSGGNTFTVQSTHQTPGVLEVTTVNSGQGADTVQVNEVAPAYLVINGQGGNDLIDASVTTTPVTIMGGAGNDTIKGGSGGDVIFGDNGLVLTGVTGLNGQQIVLGMVKNVIDPDQPGSDAITAVGGNNIISGDDGLVVETNGTPAAAIFIATANPSLGGGNDSVAVTGATAGHDTVLGGLGSDSISDAGSFNIIIGDLGSVSLTNGVPTVVVTARSVNLNLGLNTFAVTPIGAPDASFGGGNDNITVTGSHDTVLGGLGNDAISEGGGSNIIIGDDGTVTLTAGVVTNITTTDPSFGGGNDTISVTGATAGHDTILGGLGADSITDQGGHNIIIGDDGMVSLTPSGVVALIQTLDPCLGGNDTITSNGGNDTLIGGFGNDLINENGGGNNVIIGDNGQVTLTNGQLSLVTTTDPECGGNDTVNGGTGNDTILGGTGNDVLYGGTLGSNIVVGNNGYVQYGVVGGQTVPVQIATTDPLDGGNNTIGGGAGDDILIGGAGGNTIYGNGGNDLLIGNNAAVTPAYNPDGSRKLTSAGWWERDVLLLDAAIVTNSLSLDAPVASAAAIVQSLDTSDLTLVVGAYNADGSRHLNPDGTWDTRILQATLIPDGPDLLVAGTGNSALFGGRGNDTLMAGSGNDTLVGGLGNDTITKTGSGTDLLVGDNATIWSDGAGPNVLNGYQLIAGPTPTGVALTGQGTDIVPLGVVTPGDDFNPLVGVLINQTGGPALIPGSNTLHGTDGTSIQVFAEVVTDVPHHVGLLAGNDTLQGGTGNDVLVGDDFTNVSPSLTLTLASTTALLTLTHDFVDVGASLACFIDRIHDTVLASLANKLGTGQWDGQWDCDVTVVVDQTYSIGNDVLKAGGAGNNILVGDDMTIIAPTITVPAVQLTGLDHALDGLNVVQDEFTDASVELSEAAHDLRAVLVQVSQGHHSETVLQVHEDKLLIGNDSLVGGTGHDLIVGDNWVQVAPTIIVTPPTGFGPHDEDWWGRGWYERQPWESDWHGCKDDGEPLDSLVAGNDTLATGGGTDVLVGNSVTVGALFLQAGPGLSSRDLYAVQGQTTDVAEDMTATAEQDTGECSTDVFLLSGSKDKSVILRGSGDALFESPSTQKLLINWSGSFDAFGSAQGAHFPTKWVNPIEVDFDEGHDDGDPFFFFPHV
jgi:Ca2+-binding RTX toxin-like protein